MIWGCCSGSCVADLLRPSNYEEILVKLGRTVSSAQEHAQQREFPFYAPDQSRRSSMKETGCSLQF